MLLVDLLEIKLTVEAKNLNKIENKFHSNVKDSIVL